MRPLPQDRLTFGHEANSDGNGEESEISLIHKSNLSDSDFFFLVLKRSEKNDFVFNMNFLTFFLFFW